jgi:hypothetical protein
MRGKAKAEGGMTVVAVDDVQFSFPEKPRLV